MAKERATNEWARKIGQALRHVRPGLGAVATSRLDVPARELVLSSPEFADGGRLPARFTQDGDSLFPPLAWSGVPAGARSLALLVEDADAPFPRPLVHALIHAIPPELTGLPEGGIPFRQIRRSPQGFLAGRNSLARTGWMAPSPVPGHGPHRYVFQLFVADTEPVFAGPPGRAQYLRAVRPNLLAASRLIGVYQRK